VLVEVRVKLPTQARLVGDELHIEVPITPLEASKGKIVTILGVNVSVPAGVKDKQVLRVPKAGLAGGDMIVTVVQNVWQGLWRNLRDSLRIAPVTETHG
jgi:DnaJ-class molecular chaperone